MIIPIQSIQFWHRTSSTISCEPRQKKVLRRFHVRAVAEYSYIPVNMPFWLRLVMAITASVQPKSGRIVYAGSDFPHPFQLRCFQRRYGPYCAKPTRIRSGWPGQGLSKFISSGSKLVQESAGPVSGRTQPARCQFPTFRLGSVLPQTSRVILCKTSPGPI